MSASASATPTRDTILPKIKALLAKTVSNGATEAEMKAALAKAAALMEQHNLSSFQVEGYDPDEPMAGLVMGASPLGRRKPGEVLWALPIVEAVAGVEAVVSTLRSGSPEAPGPVVDHVVRVLGDAAAVEVAGWLLGHLAGQFRDLWTARRLAKGTAPGDRDAYLGGLREGVLDRLAAEREARALAYTGRKNEIARVEGRLADAATAAFPGRELVRARRGNGDADAARAGYRDAAAVSWRRSLAGDDSGPIDEPEVGRAALGAN